jgi:hypothetical protein
MKHPANLRKSTALCILAAVFSLVHAEPARAFTLVESIFLPAIQLVAGQFATVTVTNTLSGPNAHPIQLIAQAINDKGAPFKTEGTEATPITVDPNATFHFSVRAPANENLSFHTVVQLDTAGAAIGDVMGWDLNTGQLISIMAGQAILPAVQDVPVVGLAPGQSALVKVTNVSANSASPTITLYRETGALLVTIPIKTLAAGATFTHRVTAPANGSLAFFATINWGDGSLGVSDVQTLDNATGQVIAILPYVVVGGS